MKTACTGFISQSQTGHMYSMYEGRLQVKEPRMVVFTAENKEILNLGKFKLKNLHNFKTHQNQTQGWLASATAFKTMQKQGMLVHADYKL